MIDEAAAEVMEREGAVGVRGYAEREGQAGFPERICVNINEEAAHGVPGHRVVREGDLVSIDVAISVDGWWADVAEPVVVGASERGERLRLAAERVARAGRAAMGPGVRWLEVVAEVRSALDGLSLIEGLEGHGVGRALHEAPSLAFSGAADDLVLRPGMVVTLEPTVTDGSGETTELDNAWTLVTADRGWACFCECTLAIVRGGVRVLTGD